MLSADHDRDRKERQNFAYSKLGGIGEPDYEAPLRSCNDIQKVCISEGVVQSLSICPKLSAGLSSVNRVTGRIVYVYEVSIPMRISHSIIMRSSSVPHYPDM
jgi:hypothetical protein